MKPNTFLPGDIIRRTGPSTGLNINKDQTYEVVSPPEATTYDGVVWIINDRGRYAWYYAEFFELVESAQQRKSVILNKQNMPNTQTVSVPVSFVKEAHAAANSEWRRKLEQALPEVFAPTISISRGDKFRRTKNGNEYIVSHSAGKLSLVNLATGDTFSGYKPAGDETVSTTTTDQDIINALFKNKYNEFVKI